MVLEYGGYKMDVLSNICVILVPCSNVLARSL